MPSLSPAEAPSSSHDVGFRAPWPGPSSCGWPSAGVTSANPSLGSKLPFHEEPNAACRSLTGWEARGAPCFWKASLRRGESNPAGSMGQDPAGDSDSPSDLNGRNYRKEGRPGGN